MNQKSSIKPKYIYSNIFIGALKFRFVKIFYQCVFLFFFLSVNTGNVFAVGGSTCATAATLSFNGCLAIEATQTFNPSAGLDKTPTCATGTRDVWYKFTATAATHYFSLYSDFDGALALYSGACGSLTQIFCYDAAGTYSTEYKTQASLTAGNTYYLQILPFSGAGSGTYSIAIGDDQYCWTGWNNAVPTAAANYIGNLAPGASTAVKIPGAPFTNISVTDTWDVGAVTVQTNGRLNIAIPAGITGARTIDIDNLTLASSAQLNISQLHASYGLTLDVLNFSADASSSVNISACNSNFKFKAQDITIKSNASITFPNMGSTKPYAIEARNITVDANGYLTVQDYPIFTATGDLLINGTMRFDAQLGSNPVIGGNVTVNGSLNHQGHRYLYLDGIGKTISGSGNFYGGTICPLAIRGSYTFGSLSGNTIRLSHLAVLGTGTASIGANTVNTNFFLQDASATFNQNSGVLGIAGPTSLTNASSGKYSGIAWENFGIFTANPTIVNANFNEGTGTTYFNSGDYTNADIFYVNNQTVPSVTYNNLKIRTNNGYTVTLGTGTAFAAGSDFSVYNPSTSGGIASTNGALDVKGNIYIGALNGVNPSGNALTLNCAHRIYRSVTTGTITMGNNVDHAINISYLDALGSNDECFTGFGVPVFYGTVNYCGNGNQEIIPATFYNITLSGTSGIKTALGNNSVTMNWINNRAANGFSGSTFKVNFSGNSTQNIMGSYGTTFNKIEINNAADVNVIRQVSVASSADFTLGDFVASSSTEPFTFNAGSSIVTAAKDESHVNGYSRKTGNTAFTFPVGNGTKYRPIGMSAPALATDHFTAKYFQSNSNSLYTHSSKDVSIDHLSTLEYWTLDRTGGTSNVFVTLTWNPASIVSSLTDLLVSRWDGTTWKDHGNGGTTGTTSDGTIITTAAVSSFSPFTFGSKNNSNPLPIELVDFNGICKNTGILFSWNTSSETNNDYFTLEKSTDLSQWIDITNITGAGNSNQMLFYSYLYDETNSGTNYFRLKQTDFNGAYSYSSVITTSCNQEELNCFQSKGTLYVTYPTESISQIEIVVFDMLGKVVMQSKDNNSDSGNQSYDVSMLCKGIYLVRICANNKMLSQKIKVD